MPHKEIEAKDHKGDQAKYSGVLLASVLTKADVTLGAPLKGKLLTNYLVVEAADKYRAVFSLPEIDPEWAESLSVVWASVHAHQFVWTKVHTTRLRCHPRASFQNPGALANDQCT